MPDENPELSDDATVSFLRAMKCKTNLAGKFLQVRLSMYIAQSNETAIEHERTHVRNRRGQINFKYLFMYTVHMCVNYDVCF